MEHCAYAALHEAQGRASAASHAVQACYSSSHVTASRLAPAAFYAASYRHAWQAVCAANRHYVQAALDTVRFCHTQLSEVYRCIPAHYE